jgi:hypothetical protein
MQEAAAFQLHKVKLSFMLNKWISIQTKRRRLLRGSRSHKPSAVADLMDFIIPTGVVELFTEYSILDIGEETYNMQYYFAH